MRRRRTPPLQSRRLPVRRPVPPPRPGTLHVTRRLGDSIHAYAVTVALAAEGKADGFVAYRPYATLFAGGPLPVSASDRGTQWQSLPFAFHGPRHGEHVRDTMARAAGVAEGRDLVLRLDASPPEGQRPYVVLCPHAGAGYKEWPAVRWGAVAEYLLGCRQGVFICGMPGRPRVPAPAGVIHRDIDAAALGDLIAGARALVGPDSGHVHLADALGIPVVGLYGATSALTYGPYRDGSLCIDVHGEIPWPPGKYDSARHAPGDAMKGISVERVIEGLSRCIAQPEP
ncbi:hypothetical protein ASG87_05780 [Frateuria sp. Soil773]|uniref:glycosyltransferase family 9 protein n=1 Tax=Frateuria sp. Soil773 TaxID=1736407 RepID=UPI0006FE9AF2|nr:glycosyltransferase family 9 protein [Frateuria sp. Soil773]KRE89053.1 hypothetical protein ASG87_05780 [Frateuria sp. Soil773]